MTIPGACEIVGKGSVGESGEWSISIREVGGGTPKMMVVRRGNSNLCPNTGAEAALAINGKIAAAGNITAPGAKIQAEASPGDVVVAAVHTVPLNNGVVCYTLGNLEYTLEECDLVYAHGAGSAAADPMCIATRDWYAWNNLMPPKPDDFHVTGEVQVGNPGIEVLLTPRTPQGINPTILILDLILVQLPGVWPQVVVWKPVRYDKNNATYKQVQIFYRACEVANIPVVDVH